MLQLELNLKAQNTKRRYKCTNYKFILWLLQQRYEYTGSLKEEPLNHWVDTDRQDLSKCGWDTARSECKHFGVNTMELLEATTPSTSNCHMDMQKISYEMVASNLTSLKTD